MSRRLTEQETREIKRAMRRAPGISDILSHGVVDDDGRYVINSGGHPGGQLLQASKDDEGKWTFTVVGSWMS